MQRNVRLYPWYTAGFNLLFWMPVFFLYFSEHLTLQRVLQLEALYYICVVLLEVPSGYFSDSIGRRPTLIISTAGLAVSYVLFFFGDTFAQFAAAQLFLAVGISFNSGTDTSLHYDSMAALGETEHFGAREAIASRAGFQANAVSALLGGAVATIALRYAYGMSAVAAIGTFIIALSFTEPTKHETDEPHHNLVRQLGICAGYLRRPVLRWLFAFSVLMTVLNHLPYEYYQPYLKLLGADEWMANVDPARGLQGTPLAAGVVAALAMVIAGWFAGRSIRVRDRIGTGPTLLVACALQTVIIATMAFVLHPIVIGLILLRSAPRGLMTAPLNAAIAPRVTRKTRATYLSMQSLAGRLSFSAMLFGLSLVAGHDAAIRWEELSEVMRVSTAIAVAGLVALAVTVGAVVRAERASSRYHRDTPANADQ